MYFPKSQIKPNLYTSGNEFALESDPTTSYVGFYYEISTGEVFTGKTPQDSGNLSLIPIIREGDKFGSLSSESPIPLPFINPVFYKPTPSSILPKERFLPSYNSTKPTENDYDLGEYQRYFCKKNNELIYLEIDKDTFKKLKNKDPKIASDLYTPISTPWTITGASQSVFNTNKNIITLIERNQKWYGFTNYFQDKFSEYYLEE